ncbi:MAG: hypothetical protein ABI612_11455 [Betaproteobacteria bacterium]
MKRAESKWCMRALLAIVVAGSTSLCAAHELTQDECVEGGDFIKNAALSRDYGITRDAFIDRMDADVRLIQTFPPELRWFVQDEDDEAFLTDAAKLVFDTPAKPESHRSQFLEACLARAAHSADVGAHTAETSDR